MSSHHRLLLVSLLAYFPVQEFHLYPFWSSHQNMIPWNQCILVARLRPYGPTSRLAVREPSGRNTYLKPQLFLISWTRYLAFPRTILQDGTIASISKHCIPLSG